MILFLIFVLLKNESIEIEMRPYIKIKASHFFPLNHSLGVSISVCQNITHKNKKNKVFNGCDKRARHICNTTS